MDTVRIEGQRARTLPDLVERVNRGQGVLHALADQRAQSVDETMQTT
jgi:hypothetical protein